MDKHLATLVRELVILELGGNDRVVAGLRGSGLREPSTSVGLEARSIAQEWLEGMELERGRRVPTNVRSQALKHAGKEWPGLVERFRGDKNAAKLTLMNTMDAKWHSLLVGAT